MKKMIKQIGALTLVGCMALGLMTGCGSKKGKLDPEGGYSKEEAKNTNVMVVGEDNISIGETLVYLIQYAYVQGLTEEQITDETVESHKSAVLDSVRQSKIFYTVAINNDFELSNDDKKIVDTAVENTKNLYSQEFFDKYGITDDILTKVYTEQYTVEKFTEMMKADMNEKIYNDTLSAYDDYRFVTVYLMRFPTVEINDDNEPQTNDDGSYVYLSDEDKAKAKEDAQNAIEDIKSGTDYLEVAANYGVDGYSYENNGYVGAYSDELNEAIEPLENGECTDVFEDDLGYGFVVMLNNNNEENKQSYAEVQAKEVLDSEFQTLQQKWLSTVAIDTEKDLNGTVWADFDLKLFISDMNKSMN